MKDSVVSAYYPSLQLVADAPVKATQAVPATSKAIPEVHAVQAVPAVFKAVQLVNDEPIAEQDPLLSLNPLAQAEHVKTPAEVADPLEQLVAVDGIATHCSQSERYLPSTQAEQVNTPAEVADPLAHPTLVDGMATQALLDK